MKYSGLMKLSNQIRDKTSKLQGSLSDKEERLEMLNEEIEQLTVSNKDFYDKAVKFRETLHKAETLEEKRKLHEENMTNLKATMTQLKGKSIMSLDVG